MSLTDLIIHCNFSYILYFSGLLDSLTFDKSFIAHDEDTYIFASMAFSFQLAAFLAELSLTWFHYRYFL